MNYRHFAPVLLCALSGIALELVACTDETNLGGRDGDAGPVNTGSPSATLLEACRKYESTGADVSARCHSERELSEGWGEFCVRFLSAPGVQVGVADVDACSAKLAGLPCDQRLDDVEECRTLWRSNGTLANGEPCLSRLQCASGSCFGSDEDDDKDGIKCGTCAARVGAGKSCESADCAIGTTCTSRNGGESVCERLLSEGESCVSDAGLGFCGPSSYDFYCDSQRTNVCRKAAGEGESCDGTVENGYSSITCAGALVCIGKVCALPGKEGDACVDTSECGSAFVCDAATKKCVDAYRIPIAGACDDFEKGTCVRGSVCHEGVCVTPLATGAACRTGGEPCVAYHYCGPSGTCEPIDPATCK